MWHVLKRVRIPLGSKVQLHSDCLFMVHCLNLRFIWFPSLWSWTLHAVRLMVTRDLTLHAIHIQVMSNILAHHIGFDRQC